MGPMPGGPQFQIRNFEFLRRRPASVSKPRLGKRGDNFIAINKTRQGKAQLGELRVVGAYTAHGDESNFHILLISDWRNGLGLGAG